MSAIPDYKHIDYRGFVFVVHEKHGLLLLHCTRKPKKGPHYQLPGGHVDDFEFEMIAKKNFSSSQEKILLEACKLGAARELFEETGIDVREQLDRLKPAAIRAPDSGDKLGCMLKKRCYFQLEADDDDFFSPLSDSDGNFMSTKDANGPKHLMLKISEEHSGFIFEPDPLESIQKLKQHSGGTGSMALQMSMQYNAMVSPKLNAPGEDFELKVDLDQPTDAYDEEQISSPERKNVSSCFC